MGGQDPGWERPGADTSSLPLLRNGPASAACRLSLPHIPKSSLVSAPSSSGAVSVLQAALILPLLIPQERPHRERRQCPQNILLHFSSPTAPGLSKKPSISHKDQTPGQSLVFWKVPGLVHDLPFSSDVRVGFSSWHWQCTPGLFLLSQIVAFVSRNTGQMTWPGCHG